jgi:hypothetical protein
VTIPRGIRPGQHFAVLVNGQQMMVRCPPDNHEGDRLVVTAPRQQEHSYVVTVPPNVRPGEQTLQFVNTSSALLLLSVILVQVNNFELQLTIRM